MPTQAKEIRKAAFLVENGFSESDYKDSASILEKDGWFIRVISPGAGHIRGWRSGAWGDVYAVTAGVEALSGGDYGLLVIPGGRRSIEKLKLCPQIGALIHGFLASRRPIIVYNHALEMLVTQTEILKGRRVAGPAELSEVIHEKGGEWVEEAAAVSGDLLTLSSRTPVFSKEIRGFLKKITVLEQGDKGAGKQRQASRNKAA